MTALILTHSRFQGSPNQTSCGCDAILAAHRKALRESESRYIKERNDHIETQIERDRLRMRVELYEIGADEYRIDLGNAQAENAMLKAQLRKRTWSGRRILVNLTVCLTAFYFGWRLTQLVMFVAAL